MAYTTVNESTLYIQGGFDGSNSNYSTRLDQFYALDLRNDWDTSNPSWSQPSVVGKTPKQLATAGHTMSFSQNQNTLTIWNMVYPLTFAANYSLDTSMWNELAALPPPDPGPLRFYQAAIDPKTGRVYIPGCAGTSMLRYDFSSSSASILPMPFRGDNTSWSGYSFVWNEVRQSFFFFGGTSKPSASSYFFEYKTDSDNSWSILESFGSVPPHLTESCMVSAYKGTKMLLFGGGVDGVEVGTLYILDVASMTWNRGPSSQPRKGMACAVSGDNFIIWGGISWNNSGAFVSLPVEPLVYSISMAQWTTKYLANGNNEGIQPTPNPTPTIPAVMNTDSKNRAIIGGVAGVVAIVIVVVAILIFLRNRGRRRHQKRIDRDFSIIRSTHKANEHLHDADPSNEKISVECTDTHCQSDITNYHDSGVSSSGSTLSPSPPPPPPLRIEPLSPGTIPNMSPRSRDDRIRHLQEQINVRQNEILQRQNPQLCNTTGTKNVGWERSSLRGPQGLDNIESSLSTEEQIEAIYHQVNLLSSEVNRLQARLDS
ncbi:hypothetical protein FBU30_010512 [Linnemannia zychae]|nr:hypothetical protein FBU30_010512 [Linnemannia zychae]